MTTTLCCSLRRLLCTAFASLVLQFGWFVFWSVAIFLVQQYTPVLAYVLSIYLLFSFYWVSQGTVHLSYLDIKLRTV
jgi:hypothetical protein